MDGILQWIFVYVLVFGGSGTAVVRHLLDRRYQHQQTMKRLEAEKARALADQQRALLAARVIDMRLAEQSIEQFDRRTLEAGGTPPARLASSVDPDALREIGGVADNVIERATGESLAKQPQKE